jgi:hypothetical protein
MALSLLRFMEHFLVISKKNISLLLLSHLQSRILRLLFLARQQHRIIRNSQNCQNPNRTLQLLDFHLRKNHPLQIRQNCLNQGHLCFFQVLPRSLVQHRIPFLQMGVRKKFEENFLFHPVPEPFPRNFLDQKIPFRQFFQSIFASFRSLHFEIYTDLRSYLQHLTWGILELFLAPLSKFYHRLFSLLALRL